MTFDFKDKENHENHENKKLTLKQEKIKDLTMKSYHDLSLVKEIRENQNAKNLSDVILTFMSDQHISINEAIGIMQNSTLKMIFESVHNYIDDLENQQRNKFEDEFK